MELIKHSIGAWDNYILVDTRKLLRWNSWKVNTFLQCHRVVEIDLVFLEYHKIIQIDPLNERFPTNE